MRDRLGGIIKGQKGFTLIELTAVMAIIAVLVAVVSPAVTGTKDASIAAQSLQDALQVRTAASNYFSKQDEAEVRTPQTVTLTAKVNDATVPATTQGITSRWPEKFLTTANDTDFPAAYSNVFPNSTSSSNGKVVNVNLNDKDGNSIVGATLLSRFTAIDMSALVEMKLLEKTPAGTELTSNTTITGVDVPTFLWLFEKTDSSSGRQDDSREVAVFQLVRVDKNEGAVNSLAATVDLSYERIF